jgi:hypothetical protein
VADRPGRPVTWLRTCGGSCRCGGSARWCRRRMCE